MKMCVLGFLALGCALAGCGPLPLVVGPPSLQYNIAQVGVRVVEGKKPNHPPFEPYGPEVIWYLIVNYNVVVDDQRSDEQLLMDAIDSYRQKCLRQSRQLRRDTGGSVKQCAVIIYRDSASPRKVLGKYTSGIVVPVAKMEDLTADSKSIVNDCVIFPDPEVSVKGQSVWSAVMITEHHAGIFAAEKQQAQADRQE